MIDDELSQLLENSVTLRASQQLLRARNSGNLKLPEI